MTSDALDDAADQSTEIVESIKPLLAGKPPEVQGAALADLLALWLAGHYQGGNALIEQLLEHHIRHLRALLEPNIAYLKERIQ